MWMRAGDALMLLRREGEEGKEYATTKVREELYLGRDWNGKSERDKGIVPSISILVVVVRLG